MEKTIDKELVGKEEDIRIEVANVLDEIGIPQNVQGYDYLREAIQIAYEEKRIKQLYSTIAQKNGTTPQCVRSSIDHAIEMALKKGNRKSFERIFGKPKNQEKIKILEFIAIIVDNLRDKFRQETLDVTKIMKQIGVPVDITGYQYLEEAILLVYENVELIHSVTKKLYPMIANKYNTSPSSVEVAMRRTISETWRRRREILGTDYREKPTNSEFILTIANTMRTSH